MKTIPLTRHLLLKDLRHQRLWLALVWLLALALPFTAPFVHEPNDRSANAFTLANYGLLVLIAVAIVRVIRLDPPGREFHFLVTRPVPWGAVLAGKALFIGLLLLVPVLAAKLAVAWTLGIPVSVADAVLIAAESAATMGALFAAAAIVSMFLRGLPKIFVVLAVAPVLVEIGTGLIRQHSYHTGVMPRMPDITLDCCRNLVFYTAVIATAGSAALFRYAGKTPWKPFGILLAGFAVSLAAWNYWPYDLSRPFREVGTGAELPPAMRDRIKLTLTGQEGVNGNSHGFYGMWNDVKYAPFQHEVSLEGVEPPYFAVLADYHGTATLKSGREISASFGDIGSHSAVGGLSQDVLRKIAGLPLEGNGKWNETDFEIFHYFPDQYRNEDLSGASLKGEVTLEIRRAFLVKTIPFQAGNAIALPRRRFVLREVEFAHGEANYTMLVNMMTSTLRGDQGWNYWGDEFSWLVFNRAKNECYKSNGNGSNGGLTGLYDSRLLNGKFTRSAPYGDWKNQGKPIPADWAAGTEISFFGTEPCGRITFPYEIKSVDLPH